jgi:hypothetical protein
MLIVVHRGRLLQGVVSHFLSRFYPWWDSAGAYDNKIEIAVQVIKALN